jgi:hypothetical protein
MATTYKLISSILVSTETNTISFTSIPQSYTDLIIKASLRGSTTSTTFAVQVNGTTVTSVLRLFAGGNFSATDSFNEHYINPSDFTASTFGNTELYFPNYAGSSIKNFLVDSVGENNATQAYMNFAANSTGSTSAITSINLIRTGGNFVQHSTAYLYGISNA